MHPACPAALQALVDMSYTGPGGAPAPGLLELELWQCDVSGAAAASAGPMLLAAHPLLLFPAATEAASAAAGAQEAGHDALLEEVLACLHALQEAHKQDREDKEEEGPVAWLLDMGSWLQHVHEVQAWDSGSSGSSSASTSGGDCNSQHPDWGGAARSSLCMRMQDKAVVEAMRAIGQGLLGHAEALGLQALTHELLQGLQAGGARHRKLGKQQEEGAAAAAALSSSTISPSASAGPQQTQALPGQGAADRCSRISTAWASVCTLLVGFPQPGLEREYGRWLAARISGICLVWAPIFLSIQAACALSSYLQGTLRSDIPCILLYSSTYIPVILLAWQGQAQRLEGALLAAHLSKGLASGLAGLGIIAWPTGECSWCWFPS